MHPTKKGVTAVEVLPVLPDFERMAMDYVRLNFDEAADGCASLPQTENVVENALECGVVKPFSIVNDRDQTERFLSLMLPKDSEAAMAEDYLGRRLRSRIQSTPEITYKIHHDDPNMGGGNMCFFFKKDKVTYIDLHTKLTLSKKSKHSKGKETLGRLASEQGDAEEEKFDGGGKRGVGRQASESPKLAQHTNTYFVIITALVIITSLT